MRWFGREIFRLCKPAMAIAIAACLAYGLAADNFTVQPRVEDQQRPPQTFTPVPQDVFTFVRVKYQSSGGYGESWYRYEGRDWERWETDFPRAEKNLLYRLTELTSLKVDPTPIARTLLDDEIFDHPFIFMSDVGWQVLSQQERERLRDYLARGGFLWVDDFWGEAEWNNFNRNTGNLAPGWEWRKIPSDHEILSIVYPMEACPQIPARIFYAGRKLTYDPPEVHRFPNGGVSDLKQVHFRGLFTPQGRLLAVATHNTDIADGWERETESQEFFQRFSIDAYAMAVNIIVYAMSH